MSILARFNEILKANVNTLLDKMEDPSKMIDQYLRDLTEDLAEVRKETAGVIAEETRTKRLMEENRVETEKYAELAKKALLAENEGDARVFLTKKQELETNGAALNTAYQAAKDNADKMRQMHDKLVGDIESLQARRNAVKAKTSVAKTREKMNDLAASTQRAQDLTGAFARMEDKADRMLDEANAMAQLNKQPQDEAKALEEKYSGAGSGVVDAELEKMKKELGL